MSETKTHQMPMKGKSAHTKPVKEKDVVHQDYIDASNLVVGRMASVVAENLLRGHYVTIINAEKAVFTGNPVILVKLWQTRLDLRPRGNPENAPRFHKMPDRIVKSIIAGMMPARNMRGREALKHLKVFIGKPTGMEKQTFHPVKEAQHDKIKGTFTVRELSESLGYSLLK
ncbi:MAG: 50S ribosomal protein L13 [archaeon]